MQVLEKLKIVEKAQKNSSFKIIILKLKNSKNSFQGEILGRKLENWVSFACVGHDINIVDFDEKTNVIEFIKSKIDNKYDYTIVLTSKIPLITRETISNIKEYVTYKKVTLCKLPVGYVVNNKTLVTGVVDSVYSQNLDDFYIVENKKQYTYALGVLQDRINTYHMENGVELVDPRKVYIEPDVDIGSGVIIYPGNSIKGNSLISQNVILKENNVIENSKIGRDSCVSGSVITSSVLGDGVFVSPFSEISNSLIGADAIIGKSSSIKNYNVKEKENISAGSILGDK